ncbi:uncharacterized protein PHACADRAFT_116301 [Phanerochaete carnosa HHB-10118-sp]|uniref:MINDY deubiquitinase domain-containing protein n=1 Tax=Phanerochaete carnosa (strain HHB-10118-sp) TaxID=650164 RepID=K5W210_PHACS|nr:uncharacterized protein PHACADRAFT_116301 [Phanerochaete carnosa HHB-10118-sp]EKM57873.1 hypothetical protein PHACADRAFT_116301 [Phanerochaete carnosa HHB-10118-sp]
MSEHTNSETNGTQQSIEEVWYLKEIHFKPDPDAPPRRFKIVTQNFNGPCSFIAICNILILRGCITILPSDRASVSYEQLAQLVGEYLLTSCPDVDISAALSVMPVTRKGMDLNPLFTEVSAFRPAGSGGELKLFEYAGIELVHGWLADPSTPEHHVLEQLQDYDTCVNLIAEADHISRGQFLQNGQEPLTSGAIPSHQRNSSLSPDEQQKLEEALIVRSFLENTSSQLTYHGLFALAAKMRPGSLVALFRNSHLSVLYKSPNPDDSALYTLATDQVFLQEPSVVWERLEDVDGGWSSFVDSDFVHSTPAGGDYAGHTGESALAALEGDLGAMTLEERADHELARQLQRQEDEEAHQMETQRQRQLAGREQQDRLETMKREAQEALKKQRKSKKGDCILM